MWKFSSFLCTKIGPGRLGWVQNWVYWLERDRTLSFSSFCLLISDWNAKHIRMLAISNSFDESCLPDEGWGRSEKYVIMKKFKILVGKSIAYLKIVWVRDSFFFVTFICGSAQLTKCGWNEQIMRNWTFTAFHLNIAKHWRKIQYTRIYRISLLLMHCSAVIDFRFLCHICSIFPLFLSP